MRTGIELAIDTGRRLEQIRDVPWPATPTACPCSSHNNHKGNRTARCLPISEHTATVITAQHQRVRARYPRPPAAELKLLPTDRRNPDGTRAVTNTDYLNREYGALDSDFV